MHMTSICEKKMSAEVQLIHAEEICLLNFIIFWKKDHTQLKTKQLKQNIFRSMEIYGFL